ncbi:MAG: hypothetical protein MI862_04845 [Desulfobacterales bacterium]|nr:hypothetical protein [Desulfobacterales bacterium]
MGCGKNRYYRHGWCFHGYWPGMSPLADVISLSALRFRTAEKGSAVLRHLCEKYPSIQKEFSDNKVLVLYTSDSYNLITTQKPVKALEDFNGMSSTFKGNRKRITP